LLPFENSVAFVRRLLTRIIGKTEK